MMPKPTPDATPLDWALAYAQLGLRVLPIAPGRKHPALDAWQHAATDNPDTIRAWFTGLYTTHGVGLAMGDQPNGQHLVCIDLDRHGQGDGVAEFADLCRQHGHNLPETWRAVTGSGGRHLIFATPAGRTARNQQAKGNRIAPNIDVRGQGGQILVAPTLHPGTGDPYIWQIAPWDRDVEQLPEWLVELVCEPIGGPEWASDSNHSLLNHSADASVDTPRLNAKSHRTTPTNTLDAIEWGAGTSGPSAADQLRDTWDWPTELANRGWTLDRQTGTDSYWVRPGKNPRDGHSAVLHEPDGPFVVFSTDTGLAGLHKVGKLTADGSGYALSPFDFYAGTEHGGDRSAAGKALRPAQTARAATQAPPAGVDPQTGEVIALDDEPEQDDWWPVNVAEVYRGLRDGTYQPEAPTYLAVRDGEPLLYPGRVHSVFGEPGGGKTWVAYAASVERLQAGNNVLFIDWEDNRRGAAERLLKLGATETELAQFDYRNPSSSIAYGWDRIAEHLDRYALVVIDSTGESMAAGGIDPNADGQVAAWVAYAKQIARHGAAVLLIDHVAKSADNRDMEIGSQRKQAAITGAAYRCDTVTSPSRGKAGQFKLVVRKDRLGTRAKGITACVIDLADTDAGGVTLDFHLSDAQKAAVRGERFRPTALMEKVSRWLESHPGASRNTIEREVEGRSKYVREAIDVLVDEGFVDVTQNGQTFEHRVIRDFRENAIAEFEPVNNIVTTGESGQPRPPRPTASQPRPGRGSANPERTASTASQSLEGRGERDAVGEIAETDEISPTASRSISDHGEPF